MPKYNITHSTIYHYHYPVTASHHTAILEPKKSDWQNNISFNLTTNPESLDMRKRIDYFGNNICFFSINKEHQTLDIQSNNQIEITRKKVDLSALNTTCRQLRDMYKKSELPLDILQYYYTSRIISNISDDISDFARPFFSDDKPFAQAAFDLANRINEVFAFDSEATNVNTTINEAFQLKRGVCQDFTHVMLACIRSAGLPANYVSGYILTHPPEGQEKLVGADASHAWVSVYDPEYGWVHIDPTNSIVCSDQHITVSWGRDFSDISMVRGAMTGGGDHDIEIRVHTELIPD